LSVEPDHDNATVVAVIVPAVSVGAVGGVVSPPDPVRDTVILSISGAHPDEFENLIVFEPEFRLIGELRVKLFAVDHEPVGAKLTVCAVLPFTLICAVRADESPFT
jgi:hypothetical protein